jgi:membrane-associated phospholipid phosphatase
MRAFAALHALAILIYLLIPVAPPWWISLNAFAQPTSELVSSTRMGAAMDGVIVQGLIRSASNWFAAVPSLHGAYPVLMVLLAASGKNRFIIGILVAYLIGMLATTVVLNQHYIIDLVAGGAIAILAFCLVPIRQQRGGSPDLLYPGDRLPVAEPVETL